MLYAKQRLRRVGRQRAENTEERRQVGERDTERERLPDIARAAVAVDESDIYCVYLEAQPLMGLRIAVSLVDGCLRCPQRCYCLQTFSTK